MKLGVNVTLELCFKCCFNIGQPLKVDEIVICCIHPSKVDEMSIGFSHHLKVD